MTQAEQITSKCGLILGTITASLTLADWDLILAIILKIVSIVSFTIVIALNVDKLSEKIQKWLK